MKALKIRTLIRRNLRDAFQKFDVVAGPMPFPPFKIGEKIEDPLALYMCDIDTVPVNLAGLPAISILCGFADGLPIGIQIMVPPFLEDVMLQVVYTFEKNRTYEDRKLALR